MFIVTMLSLAVHKSWRYNQITTSSEYFITYTVFISPIKVIRDVVVTRETCSNERWRVKGRICCQRL